MYDEGLGKDPSPVQSGKENLPHARAVTPTGKNFTKAHSLEDFYTLKAW